MQVVAQMKWSTEAEERWKEGRHREVALGPKDPILEKYIREYGDVKLW